MLGRVYVACPLTLPGVKGPSFYKAWPSSLHMEVFVLGVRDVCYLLLAW